ncbi:MAG: hypothetical protein U0R49_02100 [Fimbriimonadales bacterium]
MISGVSIMLATSVASNLISTPYLENLLNQKLTVSLPHGWQVAAPIERIDWRQTSNGFHLVEPRSAKKMDLWISIWPLARARRHGLLPGARLSTTQGLQGVYVEKTGTEQMSTIDFTVCAGAYYIEGDFEPLGLTISFSYSTNDQRIRQLAFDVCKSTTLRRRAGGTDNS